MAFTLAEKRKLRALDKRAGKLSREACKLAKATKSELKRQMKKS